MAFRTFGVRGSIRRKGIEVEDLAPKTINDLAKIVRATAALLNALEKRETGEEMLEIWKDEEYADQSRF